MRALCGSSEWKRRRRPPDDRQAEDNNPTTTARCSRRGWRRSATTDDSTRTATVAGSSQEKNSDTGRKQTRSERTGAVIADWIAGDERQTGGRLDSASLAARSCKSSASLTAVGKEGDAFRWPLSGGAQKHCRQRRHSLLLLLLALLVGVHLIGRQQKQGQLLAAEAHTLTDFDGATFYKAPVGSRVRIACNGSHWSDESVSLVLWFKGTIERHSVPIYTVDARQRPLSNGARHFVADAYKGRARFVSKASPPYLDLAPLEPDDQSEYRCRVDYRSKPRENFLIILFVLVPPRSVQIVDSSGRSLEQIYGPLSEGSDLTLLCLSKGGRPAPSVIWKRRAKVIDDSYLTLNDFLALEHASQLLLAGDSASAKKRPQLLRSRQSQLASTGPSLVAASGSDNNQQQQQLNSINADPSLGQLEALWQEWRDWPEFDFYSSRLLHADSSSPSASFSSGNWSSQASTVVSSPTATANEEPDSPLSSVRKAAGSGGPTGQQQQQQQLLALNVDESITTSVNVLRLSNLGAEQPQQLQSQRGQQQQNEEAFAELDSTTTEAFSSSSSAATTLATIPARAPLLIECQASNLHYDLRTLIKLFAPPSLAGASRGVAVVGPDPSQSQSQSSSAVPSPGSSSFWSSKRAHSQPGATWSSQLGASERQLVETIDKTLEATLRSAAPDWPNTNGDQLAASTVDGELESPQQVGATALKQIKLELLAATTTSAVVTNATGGFQGPAGQEPLAGHKQLQSAASLVLQQLSRPHQLAAAASATAAPGEAQQAGQQQHQVGQPTGSSLVRSRLIALDVLLRPLDVRISTPPRPLSAGQMAEFSCTSSGSRPPAKLSWLKNGRPLDSRLSRQVDEPNGNASHSKLSIQLEQQDHGVQLACRAENEQLTRLEQQQRSSPAASSLPSDLPGNNESATSSPSSSSSSSSSAPASTVLEDSRTITVQYAPKVRLELGNKILSSSIREGSDIYFVCHVDSVPPIKEITWLHNERPVNETSFEETANDDDDDQRTTGAASTSNNMTEGLIISNNSLVLQRVKVGRRGHYACVAFNSEGISASNRIELRVLHAPVCVGAGSRARRPVGSDDGSSSSLLVESKRLSLHSSARLLCQMEADPPELEVSWYLNNSHSERRLLFSGRTQAARRPEQDQNQQDALAGGGSSRLSSSSATSATTPTTNNTTRAEAAGVRTIARTRAQSQLNYLVESGLDYGRLYCVARNSIGEQQRACVYEIQQPDPNEAPTLSCLAVNVTSSSVWIGCEPVSFGSSSRGSSQDSSGQQQQHRFSIEVYSGLLATPNSSSSSSSFIADEQQLQVASTEWPAAATSGQEEAESNWSGENYAGQLEANLTSESLEEPLFSVNKLRPQTSYRIHVRALDPFSARPSQPSIVRLATSRDERSLHSSQNSPEDPSLLSSSSSALPAQTGSRGDGNPTIEAIGASANQQHRLLLSALISTRSTNSVAGGDYSSSSAGFGGNSSTSKWQLVAHQQRNQQQQARGLLSNERAQGASSTGFLSRVWSALESLGSSLASPFSSSGDKAAPTSSEINSLGSQKHSTNNYQASRLQQSARNRPSTTSQSRERSPPTTTEGGQQLMDISGAILVGAVCLLLAGSLVVLLLLHRYSSRCKLSGRESDRTPGSATGSPASSARRARRKKSRGRNGGHNGGGDGQLCGYSAVGADQLETETETVDERRTELIGAEMMLQSISGHGDDHEAGSPSDRSRAPRSSLAETGATNQSISGHLQQTSTLQSLPADRCATLGNLGGDSFGLAAFREQTGSGRSTLEHARFRSNGSLARQQQHRMDAVATTTTTAAAAAAVAAAAATATIGSHGGASSLIQLAGGSTNQQWWPDLEQQQQRRRRQNSALQLYGSTGPTATTATSGSLVSTNPIRVSKSRSSLCFDAPLMGAAEQPQQVAAAAHLHARHPQQRQRLIQLSDIDRRLISDANFTSARFNGGCWRTEEASGSCAGDSGRQLQACGGWQATCTTSSSTTGASLASTDSESRMANCNNIASEQEFDHQFQLEQFQLERRQQHGLSHLELQLDSLGHLAQAVARQSQFSSQHDDDVESREARRRPASSLCGANNCQQQQDYESASAALIAGDLVIGGAGQAFLGQLANGCPSGNFSTMGNHRAANHRINGNHEHQQQLTTSCSLVSESSPETLTGSQHQHQQQRQQNILSATISSSAADNSGQLLGSLLNSNVHDNSTSGSTTQASLESPASSAIHGNSNWALQSKSQHQTCNGKTTRTNMTRQQRHQHHIQHRQMQTPTDESSQQQIFLLDEHQELLASEQSFHHHHHLHQHLCSGSLISDESASDSNPAQCTWMANGKGVADNLSGGQLHFETSGGDQVHFIELLPTNCSTTANITPDQAETEGQQLAELNLSINNKVPISNQQPIANNFGQQ